MDFKAYRYNRETDGFDYVPVSLASIRKPKMIKLMNTYPGLRITQSDFPFVMLNWQRKGSFEAMDKRGVRASP